MLAVAALTLTACQTDTAGKASPVSVLSTTTAQTTTPPTTTTTKPPTTTKTTTTTKPPVTPAGHGQVIVLDPGHNGANATHPAEINALVPAGRGQTKACNTTGTATNSGYSEHAFNWDVATRVKAALIARGYKVILTRPNDTGVGPCVNKRAAIGNNANAAAVISIHGDGSTQPGAHGFHVEYSNPPLNKEQGAPSVNLATTLRNVVRSAGFSTANYLGNNGLFGRPDLGGLNLSTRPTALIECGNMRNPSDAAMMTSTTGRQKLANAIAKGIIAYLNN
jgi:N-acetylmuramoyl-L-alanine amidase